ncbi:hypothetical protein [Paenibacillus sp. NPDC055715]
MDVLQYEEHGGWQHIYSNDYKNITVNKETYGKYLFFSNDKDSLIEIAKKEINHNWFYWAKVATEPLTSSSGYVLCLYWHNDSRLNELKERYHDKIRWKSDEDTRNGKYSEAYSTLGLDYQYVLLYKSEHKNLYEDYYRTKFHDNYSDQNFDADKIFDDILDELHDNLPEEFIAKMKCMYIGEITVKKNHRKVYICDLTEAYEKTQTVEGA